MGTIKIKTSELTGVALNWAVAKCEELNAIVEQTMAGPFIAHSTNNGTSWIDFFPSTNWAQGGPIIEREGIELNIQIPNSHARKWVGMGYSFPRMSGPTPLIAAMRCYVASKMGDEVEIPEELA